MVVLFILGKQPKCTEIMVDPLGGVLCNLYNSIFEEYLITWGSAHSSIMTVV